MDNKTINRFLIVGFGSIGKRHFSNLKVLYPKSEISILRSKKNSNIIDGAKQVFSYEDAIDLNPQVALICNPSNLHIQSAKKLIKHGVHLFFEKPLSNSLEGVNETLEDIKKQKVKAMVGYNLRYNDALLKLKNILNKNNFGKILFVSIEVGQYLPNWRPSNDYKLDVSSQKLLGGGALLELSHELDYLQWLFGKPHSVYANIQKISQLDIDVEDLVLANINIINEDRIIPCSLHLDFLQHKKSRSCKVIFEDSVLYLDLTNNSINVYKNEDNIMEYQGLSDYNKPYLSEIEAFIRCIKNDEKEPITFREGAQTLKLIHYIQKSSESKKRVLCE